MGKVEADGIFANFDVEAFALSHVKCFIEFTHALFLNKKVRVALDGMVLSPIEFGIIYARFISASDKFSITADLQNRISETFGGKSKYDEMNAEIRAHNRGVEAMAAGKRGGVPAHLIKNIFKKKAGS